MRSVALLKTFIKKIGIRILENEKYDPNLSQNKTSQSHPCLLKYLLNQAHLPLSCESLFESYQDDEKRNAVGKCSADGLKSLGMPPRAGNLLIGFLSESLVFCEKMSE